ncbi:hypothetical protein PG984_000055 [Apiospora sp. TS-2023a]
MLSLPHLATALGAAALFLSFGAVEAASGVQANLRQPASVSYQGRNDCPALCSASGPDPANWTAYHHLDQVASCQQTVFYYFSIHDAVDDNSVPHRIYACTSFGAVKKPGMELKQVKPAVHTLDSASFKLGRWDENAPRGVDLRALSKEMRRFLAAGYTTAENRPLMLFAQTASSTAGLYMGKSLQFQSTADDALVKMENALFASNNTGGTIAMQLCEDGYDSDHVFGFMATSNTSFTPVQHALQSWANATCLTFDTEKEVVGKAMFTAPLLLASNHTANSTGMNATSFGSPLARPSRRVVHARGGWKRTLLHSTPKRNTDGSCQTYTVQLEDSCWAIADAHGLTVDDLEKYNEKTWAWSGCNRLFAKSVICLSSGSPPMPAPLANAVCGPQKPGTTAPADGNMDDISLLNPCPLNACCDAWGQCGITADFCTDTNTGAPGTAKPGTNGCISNCGTNVKIGSKPSQFIKLGYYEGYGMSRECLYQDARQIDTSKYTHLHFAFGVLSADYQVSTGNALSTYEFESFKRLGGVHRVLSFGGWAFSTEASTYNIFRSGVTAANRLTMATSIANFIKANDLDGVDIDWEYPGAPDVPGIPAGGESDGANYLAFLVVLKNLLGPGKTVSIAAPASYWYLKAFPIDKIAKVVDYIVYMTYDLHGQWDAKNSWSQEGCPTGMCLRSHVNMTETKTALAMITKAGVPSNKVVVGVSSYGRSFAMADPGCHTPDCFFAGTASVSNAAKGPCTDTAGYISNAEIFDIIDGKADGPLATRQSRINQNYIDPTSHSRIVVYDDNQWVAFMDDGILAQRAAVYRGMGMGGTTNWATDLETYHDAPDTSASWAAFRSSVAFGDDPYAEGNRTGNWSRIGCDDPSVQGLDFFSPAQRWAMMDARDAWADVRKVWTDIDHPKHWNFTKSVSNTIHGPEMASCAVIPHNNCDQTLQCASFVGGKSGAAGYEIWNSMVIIHEIYQDFHDALVDAAATTLDPALKDFENSFAPIPPPFDSKWLDILLAAVGLVGTVAVSGFFNTVLKAMPYFKVHSVSYDNYKDTAKAMVSFSTSIAGTLTGTGSDETWPDPSSRWTAQQQDAFSDYMGQVVTAWDIVGQQSLKRLFSGEPDDLDLLTTMISDGKLIDGTVDNVLLSPDITAGGVTASELAGNLAKALFAFAIPQLWSLAGTRAFVLDSGYDCGVIDPMSRYLSVDAQHATAGCFQGKLYYLVDPNGEAHTCNGGDGAAVSCEDSTFSVPPGLDTLDGSRFGGVRRDDLIAGSVRTYLQNGRQNGGAATDPTNGGSFDDLLVQDVTTPGYIRIPVCSATVAFTAWADMTVHPDEVPNYPCYVKPSISDCGDSTFEDQTSDASPSVADCRAMLDNIRGTQGEWEIENAVERQHEIAHSPNFECKFGVQGKGINGNINFHVGVQDIVDIVEESIKRYGSGGKVGAKGRMSCRGTVKGQDVEWGLY